MYYVLAWLPLLTLQGECGQLHSEILTNGQATLQHIELDLQELKL